VRASLSLSFCLSQSRAVSRLIRLSFFETSVPFSLSLSREHRYFLVESMISAELSKNSFFSFFFFLFLSTSFSLRHIETNSILGFCARHSVLGARSASIFVLFVGERPIARLLLFLLLLVILLLRQSQVIESRWDAHIEKKLFGGILELMGLWSGSFYAMNKGSISVKESIFVTP